MRGVVLLMRHRGLGVACRCSVSRRWAWMRMRLSGRRRSRSVWLGRPRRICLGFGMLAMCREWATWIWGRVPVI